MTSKTDDRNLREEEFHDEWANSVDPAEVQVDASWSAVTCPEHLWFKSQLPDLVGKKVLDLGCGAGEAAVWFAKQGADVVACDLSDGFLQLVRRVAALHRVSVATHRSDADQIGLPDSTFDIVYAGNLLHHVDVAKTLQQIYRLLKPGGMILTWDPLKHNPVIKIYRRMAADVRTPDEHPLAISDVRLVRERFDEVRFECFWFFTLWIFLRFYLIERAHPSKERYWKKIVTEHKRLTPLYLRLERLDRWVLYWMPWLKRFCWTIAICGVKPTSSRTDRR